MSSVSRAQTPLAQAYHPRLGRFVSEEALGDWRLKLYGLAAPEKGVRDELHQRVFVGRPDDLTQMRPVELTPTGCVWELGIVEFERRAWIEDVIGNEAGPDIARYMGRRFDGLI